MEEAVCQENSLFFYMNIDDVVRLPTTSHTIMRNCPLRQYEKSLGPLRRETWRGWILHASASFVLWKDHISDYIECLFLSAEVGNEDIFRYCVQRGAMCNIALRLASEQDHLNIVRYLVQNGADRRAIENALYLASATGHVGIVIFLSQNGANVHYHCDSPLCFSASKGHLDVVQYLLQNRARIHPTPTSRQRKWWSKASKSSSIDNNCTKFLTKLKTLNETRFASLL